MTTFNNFANLVRNKLSSMANRSTLFQTAADRDAIYAAYLAAFPEGTNPIFRERTEHDCNCCKNFIRNIGNVVIINEDGTTDSVWNVKGAEYPYNIVGEKMHALVSSSLVDRPWFTKERSFGREVTHELANEHGGELIIWNHFSGDVPSKNQTDSAGSRIGEATTTVQVFLRGVEEITPEAVKTVRELVADNNLYRGAESNQALKEFALMQTKYHALVGAHTKNNFLWMHYMKPGARIRNTAIGTLLVDLSEGEDLAVAVAKYEDKVSGTNYKRPKALITPGMVTSAMATITELGLESSLQRRMANANDISKVNTIWSSGGMTDVSKSALEQVLMSQAKPTAKASASNVGITMEKFLTEVLPKATGMEMLFTGDHIPNLMTLTARASAADVGEPNLFKWNNAIAWAYNGNVADSVIRDRVKAAGGCVNAAMRVSLAWSNGDDLDLHVHTPKKAHVFYANKVEDFGKLDVDAHLGGYRRSPNQVVTPVENIVFTQLTDGIYRVDVSQYRRIETADQGFTVEVECNGQVMQYSKDKNGGTDNMLSIHVKNGAIVEIKTSAGVSGAPMTSTVWGQSTNSFVPVNSVVRSPNYWDGQTVGNEHFFFIVPGLKNDDPVRGIFNEFLSPELDKHRKVFEVLGDKTMCVPTDDQISGFGFSTTKPSSFVVRVATEQGKKEYTVKV